MFLTRAVVEAAFLLWRDVIPWPTGKVLCQLRLCNVLPNSGDGGQKKSECPFSILHIILFNFTSAQRWGQFWRATVRKTFSDNFWKAMSRLLTSSGYVEFTSLCAILIIISARAKCEMILHLDDNISMMKSAIIEFISNQGGVHRGACWQCVHGKGDLRASYYVSPQWSIQYESDSVHKKETMLRNW